MVEFSRLADEIAAEGGVVYCGFFVDGLGNFTNYVDLILADGATIRLTEELGIQVTEWLRNNQIPGAPHGFATRKDVFDRDGYICHICGANTSQEFSWSDPRSATVDHKFPRARGGAHHWDNVATACLRCNLSKGSKLDSELRRPKE